MPQALITIGGVPGSDEDLPINIVVQLDNVNIGGEITFLWTITDQPEGAADALSSTTIQNPVFTPKKEGTYRIRLEVNKGLADEKIDTVIARILQLKTREGIPAADETTDAGSKGWKIRLNAWLRLVDDMRADPGRGVARAEAVLAVGNVVHATDAFTIKSGLPGAEDIVVVNKLLATSPDVLSHPLGIVEGAVDGGAIGIGSLIFVRWSGLFQGVAIAAVVDNEAIFVSDNALLDRVAGTNSRQVGFVAAVPSAGVADVFFDGTGLSFDTEYQDKSSWTGFVSGGEVTLAAGLTVDVAAGEGWIGNGLAPIKITWSAVAGLAVQGDNEIHIFVDAAGVVTASSVNPSAMTTIHLATARTSIAAVVMLARHTVLLRNISPRFHQYTREVVGPIQVSGLLATENAPPSLKIDVEAGTYYIFDVRNVVTATVAITFTYWFRDGSGGFTFVTGSTGIDDAFYDDGSGTLAAIPAGRYKKDLLFVAKSDSSVEYHIVYGQETFATQGDAETGSIPAASSTLLEFAIKVGGVVVLETSGDISSIQDERTKLGQFATPVTQVTDYALAWGADFNQIGRFAQGHGTSSDTDNVSLDASTELTVPKPGTMGNLSWNSVDADATTIIKIYVNAVVVETVTLTGAVGTKALTAAVATGDQVGIEWDAGTGPGGSVWEIYIQ